MEASGQPRIPGSGRSIPGAAVTDVLRHDSTDHQYGSAGGFQRCGQRFSNERLSFFTPRRVNLA